MGADRRHRRPATTEQERENQLILYAMDLAEKQLTEGTASSQVITHYLKLGSSREKLEQERLARENELLTAKAELMAQQEKIEELYSKALDAMRTYSGQDSEPDDTDEYYDDEDIR
jgi:putative cell wall-binding protein